jgi:hypothetical protein
MSFTTVRIQVPAAIPLGHQVEITWFEKKTTGIFGDDTRRIDSPHVRDLVTGVEYTQMEHHHDGGSTYGLNSIALELCENLTVVRRLRGVVRRAVVMRLGHMDSLFIQTTLVVESLPEETSAYRG